LCFNGYDLVIKRIITIKLETTHDRLMYFYFRAYEPRGIRRIFS